MIFIWITRRSYKTLRWKCRNGTTIHGVFNRGPRPRSTWEFLIVEGGNTGTCVTQPKAAEEASYVYIYMYIYKYRSLDKIKHVQAYMFIYIYHTLIHAYDVNWKSIGMWNRQVLRLRMTPKSFSFYSCIIRYTEAFQLLKFTKKCKNNLRSTHQVPAKVPPLFLQIYGLLHLLKRNHWRENGIPWKPLSLKNTRVI